MSNRLAVAQAIPRIPTSAEVEAAGVWDKLTPTALKLDFGSERLRPAAPRPREPEWGGRPSGGLKEAILRWLEEQI